ncbi:hypothetical protein H072_2194 [Dactylellina haptotyla CBS 200.50]|uniref:G-protein coupled receptors family 2 profile 2 domain-containing protein n=1 Tax=Dactylellina haptotyla (strain CBS 200.50) TaxID=1284197 RepID=S8ALX0_DACHA|nr:hypothetical protein H072_2194 [Dactylellina haptotyla CBS 200.50]
MGHRLTPSEVGTIEAIQRMSSVLSILGASFIIITFILSPRFHKPINRLAFYAAIANILSTVATTIARAGPAAGVGSALCNMQGLFIQTFLQSDALFVAFMALNVYLTVNCLTLLFARSKGGPPIYGDAQLWCWISGYYDVLRIATFYGPVWIVILITIVLYILAGKTVFKMRNDLRRFDQRYHGAPNHPRATSSQTELSSYAAPSGKTPVSAIQMTTVTQIDHTENLPQQPVGCTYLAGENEPYQYTVTIQAGETQRKSSAKESEVDFYDSNADVENDHIDDEEFIIQGRTGSVSTEFESTPSSYSKNTSLTPTETITIAPSTAPPAIVNKRAVAANKKTMKANAAAWAYTRCAFLFFVGLLITWLPSSLNRVYGFVHPEDQQYGLYVTAALVLPAQGLWNFIIYLTTSWKACKLMWRDISMQFSWGFLRKKPSIESIPRDRLKLPS